MNARVTLNTLLLALVEVSTAQKPDAEACEAPAHVRRRTLETSGRAKVAPAAPAHVAAGINIVNEANESVEVYWVAPTGAEHALGPIQRGAKLRYESFIGHTFRVKGACEMDVEVVEEEVELQVCANEATPEVRRQRALQQVRAFAAMHPGKFTNLAGRTVSLWACTQGDKGRGEHKHDTPAGESYHLLTYVGHDFAVSEAKGEGCAAALHTFRILAGQYLYSFDDGSGAEARLEAWARELEFSARYLEEHGRHWAAHWPRKPTELHIQMAEQAGDELAVPTRSPPVEDPLSADYEFDGTIRMRALSTAPRAFLIDEFLSAFEADHLVGLGASRLERSTGLGKVIGARTSRNTWVAPWASPVAARVFRRAGDALGLEPSRVNVDHSAGHSSAEPFQLVRYLPGQRYDAHYDWGLTPNTRFATLLLYLNTPAVGGATAFPMANDTSGQPLMVQPRKGSAVLFYNMLPDGNTDVNSLHAALPVSQGFKWMANIWVWDPVRASLF